MAYWTAKNSRFPRCVDSRATALYVERHADVWQVVKRGEAARQESGPQFPGGSLVFVRALEVIGGRGRWRAFDLVERASAAVGLGLQFHLDDDAGRRDLTVMRDDAIIALVQRQWTGCGFVEYAWGNEGSMVVSEARRRGWRVQFVTGAPDPRGAWVNLRDDATFDTAAAVAAGEPHYNLDEAAAHPVLAALEQLLRQPGFAEQAATWMLESYGQFVESQGVTAFKTRQ